MKGLSLSDVLRGFYAESELNPTRQRRYPVFFDFESACVAARGRVSLVTELLRLRIGAGWDCVESRNYAGFVFYPPGWRGHAWTHALDRQWRAIEVLDEHEDRKRLLSRRRLERLSKPRGRALPSTLLTYSGRA